MSLEGETVEPNDYSSKSERKFTLNAYFVTEQNKTQSSQLIKSIPLANIVYHPMYLKGAPKCILFKSEYNLFTVTVVSFISYVEFLFIELSKQQYDLLLYIMPGLGITLVISGFCVERSKMTQYFGCKNKWAYTSQENWTNFNFLGGLVMKVSGVMLLTGFFIKNKIVFVIAIVFTIIGVIAVHLYGDAQMRRSFWM